MSVTNKFTIGMSVWLKMDKEQRECMILEVRHTHTGIYYLISDGENEKAAYEIELSNEVDTLRKVS